MSKSNFDFMEENNDLINCYYRTKMKLYAQRAEKEVYNNPILSIQYSRDFLIWFLKGIVFQENLKRFIKSTDHNILKYIKIIKNHISFELPSFCFTSMNEILKINDLIQQKNSNMKNSEIVNNALNALKYDFYLAVLFTNVYYFLSDNFPEYHQPSKNIMSDENKNKKTDENYELPHVFYDMIPGMPGNFCPVQKPIPLSIEKKSLRAKMTTQHFKHLFATSSIKLNVEEKSTSF